MPHVDITMIPGRDDQAKQALANKVQLFLAQELQIDPRLVSVSVEDVEKENWSQHMDNLKGKKMIVYPRY